MKADKLFASKWGSIRRIGNYNYIQRKQMMYQCDAEGSFQKFLVATRIFSLPLDSGSFWCMVAVHLTARAIRATLSMTSGESLTKTVPSGRNIRSISTIKSTRLHLKQSQDYKGKALQKQLILCFFYKLQRYSCHLYGMEIRGLIVDQYISKYYLTLLQ